MSRDEEERLRDILEALKSIEEYVGGSLADPRVQDPVVLDAVLFRLIVIGEAVKGLSDAVLQANASVRWKDITGLRDVIAHQYFRVQREIIEDTIHADLPALRQAVEQLLS